MTSHGLGKTCYGDVLVSKSLTQKKSVAAFYILASDEMFIRADTPDNWDTVRVVCHELAHRLDHKFLSSKKSEIEKLYWTINNNAMDIKLPKRGETCLYEGKPMIVTDLDFRRMSVTIIEDAPPKCFACGQPVAGHQPDAEHKAPILRQRAYVMPAETFYQLQGKEVDPSKITFITNYAKENAAENFAEMVSFYVLGKLPPHLVALLEPILM